MSKTLVLIRHAHRDTANREVDNGLSEKGREQAKNIKRFFEQRFGEEDFKRGLWFVSSPKLRCVETLLPAAKALERTVDVHPELDEQNGREGLTGLRSRIDQFLKEWKESKVALTVLCSHGDWLPLATHALLGFEHEFKKGGWLEVESEGSSVRLKWYIPTFKPLYR